MLAALDTMAADPQPLADAHIATIRTALGLPNAQKNAQSIEAAANDPQKRREIAKKAADIRWAGHKGNGKLLVKPETIKSKPAHKCGRLFTFQTVNTLKGKRSVQFGKKLNDHFQAKDKDRINRLPDLKYAIEAVRRGRCTSFYENGEKRLQFLHDFSENDKNYTMKVIAVHTKKRWQVLTYNRFSRKRGT